MDAGLTEYEEKRDFRRTPEPSPQPHPGEGPLVFVVHQHHARQLHYDFRLELDGVLKSWAVPKGPSTDPDVKHLAAMVEDHPLDYGSFEGVIPKGEYGAGEVIIWDSGTYSPDEGGQLLFHERAQAEAAVRQGLEKGKLSISLRGHKLKGSWTLVKVQRRERDWLLIKHRDEYAQPDGDILKEDGSVLSNLTIADLKADRPAINPHPTPLNPRDITGARRTPFPTSIAPMLASSTSSPFSHPDWVFEPKLDGYRIIAFVRGGEVMLMSRRGVNVTGQYEVLKPDLARQPASELVLDGEIIALDDRGRLCFQCLQQYLRSMQLVKVGEGMPAALVYYVFDLLFLDGYDLRQASLRSRKGLLHGILHSTEHVRLVDYFANEGERIYHAAISNGLEGVMAKHIDSPYESGRRSQNWLKVKATRSDEFVVGGYTAGEGGRAHSLGALLLGHYNDTGNLVFVGHVGSGFDEPTLVELKNRLDTLRTDQCPFSELPPLNAPTTWVRPELVAEVKFSEWTQDGLLRIPVFLRLREDKSALEVRKAETVAAPLPDKIEPDVSPSPALIDDILRQLRDSKPDFVLEVQGTKLNLTNLDKPLWPPTTSHPPLTKRDLLVYLTKVSPYFLPHLKDRPLTLSRYPDGVAGEHFWQKHWNNPMPDPVQSVNIRSEEDGSLSEYLMCNNLLTLLWLGQLANIEFHTWFSRLNPEPDMTPTVPQPDMVEYLLDYPDFVIFDLDPYIYSGQEPAGAEPELNRPAFAKVCEIAPRLKEVLDSLSLSAFIKTSGKTGLHIYVPIVRKLEYRAVRAAAETIGRFLRQRHPSDVTMEWAQEKRTGKVFVDYSQNVRGKTLASAYSPRPSLEATVSTPLRWDELGKIYPTDFSILTVPDRLKETSDLWANILEAKRNLQS